MTVRTNLCANPSFDIDLTDWSGAGGFNGTLARMATPIFVGAGSMRIQATAAGDARGSYDGSTGLIAVTAGHVYTLSAAFRTAVTSRWCKVEVVWYTAGSVYLGTSSSAQVADNTSNFGCRPTITVAAPATAAKARLDMRVNACGLHENHYVDAVLFEESNANQSYFDGDTPDTPYLTYAWSGVTGRSPSTQTSTEYAPITAGSSSTDSLAVTTHGSAPIATDNSNFDALYSPTDVGSMAPVTTTDSNAPSLFVLPSAVEYLYEGDVVAPPGYPVIWFASRPYGFATDVVYLYGTGLGALQSTYTSVINMNPPDGSTPVPVPVTTWTDQPAGADSYTSNRIIYAGTITADPIVNVDCQIIKFSIPTGLDPGEEVGPLTYQFQISNTVGVSNLIDWIVYPKISVLMDIMKGALRTGTKVRVRVDPPPAPVHIEQLYAVITPEPYIVVGNRAERKPTLGVYSKSFAKASTPKLREDLEPALNYTMKIGTLGHYIYPDGRWLPDSSYFTDRDDVTGISSWRSIDSPGHNQWIWWDQFAESAGYVDPTYSYHSRMGEINRPAFVLSGNQWLKLNTTMPTGPVFTFTMVVMLHDSKTNAQLLSSFSTTPRDGTNPFALSQEKDNLAMYAGAYTRQGSPGHYSYYGGRVLNTVIQGMDRPVIIAVTSDGSKTSAVVIDRSPQGWSGLKHAPLSAVDLNFYLGRPPDEQGAYVNHGNMVGEILEMSLWKRNLTGLELWSIANQLDSIYGVTG
jgi:hypothetical protein